MLKTLLIIMSLDFNLLDISLRLEFILLLLTLLLLNTNLMDLLDMVQILCERITIKYLYKKYILTLKKFLSFFNMNSLFNKKEHLLKLKKKQTLNNFIFFFNFIINYFFLYIKIIFSFLSCKVLLI